ncbi:hypothetical protein OGZ51_06920 [Lactococcus lactis]|uniref:Uncharacterized protein n=1 Tax=Lactococcus lactis TaxID=1358 RepID=A0A9X4S4N5_9LACT|nr:hypothetical protein [Lactococcus lactis]MDG4983873.1 hypothetical protein [Lactococcus lactis]
MFKKLVLSSMALLAMTPVVASVLPQSSVSANAVRSLQQSKIKSINASGFVMLESGGSNSDTSYPLGIVDNNNLEGVTLQIPDVIDPGMFSDSCSVEFSIYNVTTKATVSDVLSLGNGYYMGQEFPMPVAGVSKGDQLEMRMHAVSGAPSFNFNAYGYEK